MDLKVMAELEQIRKENGELLRPIDVVKYAEDPKTALHSHFTWDDENAAREYRLEEARRLIRVAVTILPHYDKPIRVFVSLKEDRLVEGGGYRTIVEVMSDEDLRLQLIKEALADLQAWERKYNVLTELAPIFEAAKTVRAKNEEQ